MNIPGSKGIKVELKHKKVLVTGGAGFIGSHTVASLLAAGAQVTVIDNLSTGDGSNISPASKFYDMNIANPGIEQIYKEEKPDIVYHFAFNVLVPKSVENPAMDIDSIAGSINLLQCVRKYGAEKVFFPSSGFLYGNTDKLPTPETEPVQPISPYVVSKHAVENYLWFYRRAFNIHFVIFRYAAVYGPGQSTGAMADYIRKLANGQQAEIWGDGAKTRDYVYIDDVVRANLLALDVPNDYPVPLFNIGTGKQTSLNEIYTIIALYLNKHPQPIYHPDRPGEQMKYALDSAKIKQALGWAPQTSLDAGLEETINHYLSSKRLTDY